MNTAPTAQPKIRNASHRRLGQGAAMWLGAAALGVSGFPASAQVETYDAASPQSRIMFVFDGSNSMWAPVEGGRKIDVARDAFAAAIDAVPATTELGLTLYGHRSRGDCSDIEIAVPMTMDPDVRSRMSNSVAAVRPKGKTPLSNAVRQAAESMKYEEVPATIVLITDGVESCGVDPCSLAQDLEELGVDFKTHVIGFDLSGEEQDALICMAEETGGTFFPAQDSTSLEQAFDELMVVETAAPAPDAPPARISVWVDSVRRPGKPLGLKSEGVPGNDMPVIGVLGPDDTEIADARVGFMPSEHARTLGLHVNDSRAVLFEPRDVGPHTLQLDFGGFVQSLPFEITAGGAETVRLKTGLTAVHTTLANTDGQLIGDSLTYARFCPPEVVDSKDVQCIKRKDAHSLIPPGEYRVSAFRHYNWRINGNRIVTVGPANSTQTVAINAGDDAGEFEPEAVSVTEDAWSEDEMWSEDNASTDEDTLIDDEWTDPDMPEVYEAIPLNEIGQVDAVVDFAFLDANGTQTPPPGSTHPETLTETDMSSGYSLGCGGFVTFRFDNNTLANGPGPDLAINERGAAAESVLVEISPDGSEWTRIGVYDGGGLGGMDLADSLSTPALGKLYTHLRLTDQKVSCSGSWPGADIGMQVQALNGTIVED